MANEYALADQAVLLWGKEATPYTQAASNTNYFGLLPEGAGDMPNPNEQKALSSVGHRRAPYVYSGEEREYPMSIPVLPIDARFPFDCCIGGRTKTSIGTSGYATISNSEVPPTISGAEILPAGTYNLRVTVDGTLYTVTITSPGGGETLTTAVAQIQAALRVLTGSLETAVITSNTIKISSVSLTGASSTVLIQAGLASDLLTAIDAIAGITPVLDTPVPGVTSSYNYTWDEDDKISDTITVYHGQRDMDYIQHIIGCKGSLKLSCKVGEALKATLDLLGTHRVMDTTAGSFVSASPAMATREPWRFWMVEDAQLNAAGGAIWKDLLTIKGFDFGWNNACRVMHTRGHDPSTGLWSREGYLIAEEGGADKYDMTIEATVGDAALFEEALNDDTLYDFYIKMPRTPSSTTDYIEIWLYECKIGTVPIPIPASGAIDMKVKLHPRNTRITIVQVASITI